MSDEFEAALARLQASLKALAETRVELGQALDDALRPAVERLEAIETIFSSRSTDAASEPSFDAVADAPAALSTEPATEEPAPTMRAA